MKLPVSSFKVLRMIILGYLHQGGADRKPANLKAVEGATGVASTKISGNNGSLADLGLIEKEGNSGYRLTEKGLEVARALEFEEPELKKRALGGLLLENDVLAQTINVLRVRGGLDSEALAKHLMMASGEARATAGAQTGARAIVDMLLEAGLVEQDGETFTAVTSRTESRGSVPLPTVVDDAQPSTSAGFDRPRVVESPVDRDLLEDHPLKRNQRGSVEVAIAVSLSGDDLADTDRAAKILESLRRLAELSDE